MQRRLRAKRIVLRSKGCALAARRSEGRVLPERLETERRRLREDGTALRRVLIEPLDSNPDR
jgi:hypothetical protein